MNLKTLFAAALCLVPLCLTAHAQEPFQQQSDTTHGFFFFAVDQTTGTPDTGLTLTMRVTKQPGSSSVVGSGTFTQTDATNLPGYYFYAPSASDVNTLGDTIFQPAATAGTGYANAVINSRAVDVVPFNPYSAANLGLTALPTAPPSGAGGLVTADAANKVGVNNFPATVSLSGADETAIGGLAGNFSTIAANFTGLPAGVWGYGSGRTVTGGTITSIPNATVGGYATGFDPATLLLVTPGNKLATNGTGQVTASNTSFAASNLPSDYQQRGAPVTLPAAPTGYGVGTTAPTWYTAPTNPTDYAKSNVVPSWYASSTPPTVTQIAAGVWGQDISTGFTGTQAASILSGRLAASAYVAPTTPPTAVQIRQEMDSNSTQFASLIASVGGLPSAILNSSAGSFNTAGTIGAKINAGGTAGDPWATDISSGSYTGNQAGRLAFAGRQSGDAFARLGTPAGASVSADIGTATTGIAAANAGIAALPNAAALATAIFGSSFITIPGSHTTSGTQVALTFAQWQAVLGAVPAADRTQTVPVLGGTSTTSYYLAGQAPSAGTLVYVSTDTYDALGHDLLRTVKIAQPFPAVN